MRDTTIAKNYAEALLALASRAKELAGWGRTFTEIATAIENDQTLSRFLESPRVSAEQKRQWFARALGDRVPRLMLAFLTKLVSNRRQMLIPAIAIEYWNLVDAIEGRVHARVTVARPMDDKGSKMIARELSRALGKDVVPHLSVNPAILGGVVVKVGDTVMDGSVRRRLALLRGRMLAGR
jgi:F-type H+-transporting ATPase subunit delta